ncbi:MAG TPA: S9 family peptidase [Opitutaceae bacterium]
MLLAVRRTLVCTLLVTAAATASAASAPTQPSPSGKVPLEHFFAQAAIRGASLSPDGKRIAFLAPVKTRMSVVLYEVATEKLEVVVHDPKEEIDVVGWKTDDLLIFAGDIGGNESMMYGSLDLKTRKVQRLAESRKSDFVANNDAGGILDILERDPDNVVILGTKENAGRKKNAAMDNPDPGVYLLNVRNGSRKQLEAIDGTTAEWMVDNNGILRLQVRMRGKRNELEHRAGPSDKWSVLYSHEEHEGSPWEPLRFTADNNKLYVTVTENAEGAMSIRTFDVTRRTLSDPLFSSKDPIRSTLFDDTDFRILGVTTERDKPVTHWIDPEFAALASKLKNTFPDTHNDIVSSSRNNKVHLIRAWSDRDAGAYYVLDLRSGKMALLSPILPDIDPDKMRPMEPIAFTARDGMKIPGYLTRPAGAAGPVPLILNPHGGPYGIRDNWAFVPEVQFLANRGYAVLQVNYRGSGGLGRRHHEAGRSEWGGKMQDDLTDAVKWAIEQKIADPARIAVYGASYGGYAALAALTYTPDLFKCGVNYVGVSDLRYLTSWNADEGRLRQRFYETWIALDSTQLAERSPVNHVERIRVPSLHVYGLNDPRVKIEHWRRLEAELKKHKKPYEAIESKEEGHGFQSEGTRIGFYRKLEEFLAKNL